jgi:hypothetical protein
MKLTKAQIVSLRWLGLCGSSRHLPRYQSRGLASLERRGFVHNAGGRGRDKDLRLTESGRAALATVSPVASLAGPATAQTTDTEG